MIVGWIGKDWRDCVLLELWLVRHGETEWSATGRHTSRTDVSLTEYGLAMAQRLGEYLAPVEFAAVIRSPMARARETCEVAGLAERALVDPALCEWNYGVYEGRTTKEIQQEIPGWSVWKNEIVNGETLEQVGARADEAIEHAAKAATSGGDTARVALFAHAHILRILAARWVGLPAAGGSLLSLNTASVSVLGHERETRVVRRWNKTFEETQ
jgi:broad specificity phosphatase PhoE